MPAFIIAGLAETTIASDSVGRRLTIHVDTHVLGAHSAGLQFITAQGAQDTLYLSDRINRGGDDGGRR